MKNSCSHLDPLPNAKWSIFLPIPIPSYTFQEKKRSE